MEYTVEFGLALGFIFFAAITFYAIVCVKTYGTIKEQETAAKIRMLTRKRTTSQLKQRVISIDDIRDEAHQAQDVRQKARQINTLDQ